MRLDCPICGNRDRREFYYQGDAVMLARPAVDAGADAWDRYLHLRDNPAGQTRDTVTHAVSAVELASDVKGAMA